MKKSIWDGVEQPAAISGSKRATEMPMVNVFKFVLPACMIVAMAGCGSKDAEVAKEPTDVASVNQKTESNAAKNDLHPGIDPNLSTDKSPESTRVDQEKWQKEIVAWFDNDYQKRVLDRSPESLTYLGRDERKGEWNDISEEMRVESLSLFEKSVERLNKEFPAKTLEGQAKLSADLFNFQYKRAKEGFEYRYYSYPFNQMFGRQSTAPAFLINQHRVKNRQDAETYVQRLESFDDMMNQYVDMAIKQKEMGIAPPKFVYDHVLRDSRNILSGAPFDESEKDSTLWADINAKIEKLDVDDGEKNVLLERARNALLNDVKPAYERVILVLSEHQSEASEDDGVWKLPNGDAYYQTRLRQMTTTDLSAEQIHQIGLDEVARIHEEMEQIIDKVGFEGDLRAFFEFTRTGEQFFYADDDAGRQKYLSEATTYIDDMKKALDGTFNIKPKADLRVKPVEAFREKSAGKAFYQRPSEDGSRPGTFYANLYSMKDMPTYQLEALAYHEGVPGHHMQIAISQELEDVPMFRKFGGFTAYIEGWGLYSELLPKEMGFYEDPYSDFGRLAMELWRAARLVVDTGLHHKKWTREEAIDYLVKNTPNPKDDCENAIERYIVMPGQATAYKIGMLKILDLREDAKTRLGDQFSLASFHDVILKDGAVPLEILENKVDAWVEKELAKN